MCDIDHFKLVNDRHGPPGRRRGVERVYCRISGNLRLGKDWLPGSVVRSSWWSFRTRAPRRRGLVAERLRERIGSSNFEVVPERIAITASFGVCALEHHVPMSLHGPGAANDTGCRCGPVIGANTVAATGLRLQHFSK